MFNLRLQLQDLLLGTVGLRLALLRNINTGDAGFILLLAQIRQALVVVDFLLQQFFQREIALQLEIGGGHRAG
ncbi:hypothetical protein D3C73_1347450 [compost metagenome]